MKTRITIFLTMGLAFGTLSAGCGDTNTTSEKGECAGVVCSEHGLCVSKGGVAFCDCADGYQASGADFLTCSESTAVCATIDCSNHGTCVVNRSLPFCDCDDGFHVAGDELSDCQPNTVDACQGITCSNYGTCTSNQAVPFCDCDDGFRAGGPYYLECLAVTNPCTDQTCSDHGLCVVVSDTAFCDCDDGYELTGAELLACTLIAAGPCADVTCSEHGECVVDGQSAFCSCDQGFVADGLECLADSSWPANPEDYQGQDVVYAATLSLPDMQSMPCCFDFGERSKNGTGAQDNAYATLLRTMANLASLNVDDLVNQDLENGGLVLLFDHRGLDAPASSQVLPVVQLEGAFANTTTYAEASAGTGQFAVLKNTFLPGTGQPRSVFPAERDGNDLMGGPTTSRVSLPGFFGTGLSGSGWLALQEARLSAELDLSGDVAYQHATISGYVELDDLRQFFNEIIAERCACLGIEGDFFSDTWSAQCVSDAATLCEGEDEGACVNFGGPYCSLLGAMLQSSADIDIDGDSSTYEALSFGARFTAVPGEIVGLYDPCTTRTLCTGDSETTFCQDSVLHVCQIDSDGCLVDRFTDCAALSSTCEDDGSTAQCVCFDAPECEGRDEGELWCDDNTASFCHANGPTGCLTYETEPCEARSCAPAFGCECNPVSECDGLAEEYTCDNNTLVWCGTDEFGCYEPSYQDCETLICDATVGLCVPAGSCLQPFAMTSDDMRLSGEDFSALASDTVEMGDPSCTPGAPGPELAISVSLLPGQTLVVTELGDMAATVALIAERCYEEPSCLLSGTDDEGALVYQTLSNRDLIVVVYPSQSGGASDFDVHLMIDPQCGNGTPDEGEACDDGNFIAADGCTDCNVDPNTFCDLNTSPTACHRAEPIALVPNVETALIGGPIEFGTQYYYIITMPIAGVLDVFVDSSNGGDPDIFLFDSSSNLVLESASLGSEAITNLPVLADDYVLRVDAYGAPLEDHFVSLLLTST